MEAGVQIGDKGESVTEEKIEPVNAASVSSAPNDEPGRVGVREIVNQLNRQASNAHVNPPNATKTSNERAAPKRPMSAAVKSRPQSWSPDTAERKILYPMRDASRPIASRPITMRAHSLSPDRSALPTKHYIDLPSPRDGSPDRHIPATGSPDADEKGFLKEMYENPKRRPLSDIIRQFSRDDETGPRAPVQRSQSSPPARRTSRLGETPRAREGSPPRFGERLGAIVSMVDDEMFRKEGSIRMKPGEGKKIVFPEHAGEGEIAPENQNPEGTSRGRRRTRKSVQEELIRRVRAPPRGPLIPFAAEETKHRSDSRSSRSGSEREEDTRSLLSFTDSKSPIFDTFEGKLLASTPVGSTPIMSPEYLSPRSFERDEPRRRSYDEANLLADKELQDGSNFELRRKPLHKPKGKKKDKSKSRKAFPADDFDQELLVDLGSDASSLDLSPVAGVSPALSCLGSVNQANLSQFTVLECFWLNESKLGFAKDRQ